MSDFFSSPSILSRQEFDQFTSGNVYWNTLKTIFQTQWVPYIRNANRSAFEAAVRKELEWFKIFRFNSSGIAVEEPQNSFSVYGPITYCAPPADYIVGLDLYNDPIEGPILQRAQATGSVLSAKPFELRGLAIPFRLGMTIYMPLYQTNGTFTVSKTDDYLGSIVSVFLFHPLLSNVLSDLTLRNTDVFLFEVDSGDALNASTYLAHFESEPESTMPNLLPPAVYALRPSDIAGDFVTAFTADYDVTVVDRTFRVLVRAREGSFPRDPLVYTVRSARRPLAPLRLSMAAPPEFFPHRRPGPSCITVPLTPPPRSLRAAAALPPGRGSSAAR